MAVSVENLLVCAIVNTRDYPKVVDAGIDHRMFNLATKEMKWIERQYQKTNKIPSAMVFKRNFPEFRFIRSVDDIDLLIEEFKTEYTRQELINSISDITDLISTGEIDKAVTSAQSDITRIATKIGTIHEIDLISDWEEIYEEIEERRKRQESHGMAGVSTGFGTFDGVTGGIQAGQLVTVAARLGEGKTMTMIRMAVSAIIAGHRVHYAALEMSRTEVGIRVHNMLSGEFGRSVFDSMSLAQGKGYDPQNYKQFLRDLPSVIKGSMTISDSRRVGSIEVASQLERNKPDIYFFDYLTLGKMAGDGGWKDIGNFMKDLKALAGDHKVGIVVASQLNRGATQNKDMPGSENLAESDAIGQDSDVVITMRKRTKRVTEYSLAKNRHGLSGANWYAHIEPSAGVFKEVGYNEAQDLMDDDKDADADARSNS